MLFYFVSSLTVMYLESSYSSGYILQFTRRGWRCGRAAVNHGWHSHTATYEESINMHEVEADLDVRTYSLL